MRYSCRIDVAQTATTMISTLITEQRVVQIAHGLCSIASPRPHEGRVAEWLADELERAGVDVTLQHVLPDRPNVIARVPGGSAPPLMLNGHIDASVHPGPWRRDANQPWVEDGRMFGGGITDMKGGVAAMAAAVEAAARIELPGDLVFHAVMCHDTNALGAKFALADGQPWSGYGICGEPTDLRIQTAHGGAVKFRAEIVGRTAHISRVEEGIDALQAAVAAVEQLRDVQLTHHPEPRLAGLPRALIGRVEAGEAPGAVAEHASILGDVRTVPGMTPRTVCADVEAALAAACPDGVRFTVRPLECQRPLLASERGPLIDALERAHEQVHGARPERVSGLPTTAFVTDAADMAAFGIESVVYGPCDWHYAPNENVAVADLLAAARAYLATRLLLDADEA